LHTVHVEIPFVCSAQCDARHAVMSMVCASRENEKMFAAHAAMVKARETTEITANKYTGPFMWDSGATVRGLRGVMKLRGEEKELPAKDTSP
jgi:hypothetical protein